MLHRTPLVTTLTLAAGVDMSDYAKLRELWRGFMHEHTLWSSLMDAAAAGNYEAVSKGLSDRFD